MRPTLFDLAGLWALFMSLKGFVLGPRIHKQEESMQETFIKKIKPVINVGISFHILQSYKFSKSSQDNATPHPKPHFAGRTVNQAGSSLKI